MEKDVENFQIQLDIEWKLFISLIIVEHDKLKACRVKQIYKSIYHWIEKSFHYSELDWQVKLDDEMWVTLIRLAQ